jgi:hypothetical protein
VLDQTGLAEKGGAVSCDLRIAPAPSEIDAVRIAAGDAAPSSPAAGSPTASPTAAPAEARGAP